MPFARFSWRAPPLVQSDGAGNYDCTAFMDTVKDTFKAAGVRLTRHVVTEVGDGKNLAETHSGSGV
eukprot:872251-Prymnesium_polylepis.1